MQKSLTPQQRSLIQALLLRSNVISQAAAQVGISPMIARAWMQKPFMRDAFIKARKEAITGLINEAQSGKVDNALDLAASIEPDTAKSFKRLQKSRSGFLRLELKNEPKSTSAHNSLFVSFR